MGALRAHHTSTTGESWDGPKAEATLRDDEKEAYYRKEFAWQDSRADPTNKTAYRFPHHEVSARGRIGAANLKAASSGIGILNGARGGTSIPEKDRIGVYRHLAAHLEDAGKEPPALEKD
jgi:hypothetical protein